MKESVIKVLKVKPNEHPEVYMLKNTLEAMQEEMIYDVEFLNDYILAYSNEEIRERY
ncbi:hypothetical protein [Anaerotignum sp.]|uniref:hypothetical protein n=1 Tax=Anaerotignum sp. TaxID=2039241 RepID=UPI002A83E88C|nr:hypothetical protein [Anaerotignum sp.]MDY3596895.1 hypothetical protein [Anaerotignum sp.]